MQGGYFLVSHHASVQFVFAVQPQPIYLTHRSAARPRYNHPLSLNTFSCHIRSCTHTTHTHPQQASQFQRSPTKIVDDIQPHEFSINHRSTPWLVTTPIIDLGLNSLVYLMYRYVCKHIPADNTTHACPRDLLIENDASPGTVNLTRTNKDRSRAGESLKLRLVGR